jgi:hypothetical protein
MTQDAFRLAGLVDQAGMLHLRLQDALGFNFEVPAELVKARGVVRRVGL